jgi:hypothetical protein
LEDMNQCTGEKTWKLVSFPNGGRGFCQAVDQNCWSHPPLSKPLHPIPCWGPQDCGNKYDLGMGLPKASN